MKALTSVQVSHILTLLDKGKSTSQISAITGRGLSTISIIHFTHCPSLAKPPGGHPCKLSPSDIHYSIQQISSQKAGHATEVTKILKI
jgi:hypothetical protein